MAYTKQLWKDKNVEHPRRYEQTDLGDGKVMLVPAPGEVYQAATPLNAEHMNHIEQGIYDAHDDLAEHEHGDITKDGKIGTIADKFLVTGTNGAIGVKTKQEAASLIGVSNPNILHNWDFRNPINQRGANGNIGTNEFFADRWSNSNTPIVVKHTDYITIPKDGRVRQKIEGELLIGCKVTASIKLKSGGIVYGSTIVKGIGEGTANAILENIGRVWLTQYSGFLAFELMSDYDAINVEAVKLELEHSSTLHLDPPMDWAVEMPKCQRFCIALGIRPIIYGFTEAASNPGIAFLPLPITMRITPTISNTVFQLKGHNFATSSGTITDVRLLKNGVELKFVGEGFTGYVPVTGHIGVGDTIFLYANL